ncbi:hypothetical protein MKK84_00200 [Methylobacterium sp. E-065]|uniref:hypothetical protein n=1 Tax=Methylobacterium sp. E-065 TaxID=2836583 RepID=UPI001FB92AB3|nr:hypothetical protein [Methylobacterium sp. E-065]MCJ2015861.1 hypothetical protein [Methylobacterium sp. E-065]
MVKLFDRQDGAAADWPLIAETLLKEAFAAIDQATADPRTAALALSITRRVHSGAYDRITAASADAFKDAPPQARSASAVDYEGPQHHPADKPDTPLAR